MLSLGIIRYAAPLTVNLSKTIPKFCFMRICYLLRERKKAKNIGVMSRDMASPVLRWLQYRVPAYIYYQTTKIEILFSSDYQISLIVRLKVF